MNYPKIICENDSDQTYYDKFTDPSYPRTEGIEKWLDAVIKREGRKFVYEKD